MTKQDVIDKYITRIVKREIQNTINANKEKQEELETFGFTLDLEIVEKVYGNFEKELKLLED